MLIPSGLAYSQGHLCLYVILLCLYQMMGGSAREVEFINYRAGRSTRTGASAGYDLRVLEGLKDPADERIYEVTPYICP